ncbi:MAG TPA: sensor histidine kinase, partial [Clostridia bacterium]|nr:sensor histidine kinase [Clostridia bacterium]
MSKPDLGIKKSTTLTRQLRALLAGVVLPFLLMTAILLSLLWSYNREYAVTLLNVTTASEFNFEFKNKLDLDMYYFVVGSKSMDHLPLEEVDKAREVILRLQKTTTQKENQWRIRSMLNLSNRLSECMQEIQSTRSYDARIEQLEHNIYIITDLIQTYMHAYIYDEVRELSTLQKDIDRRVSTTVLATLGISMPLVLFMLMYSAHFTRNITDPILELCRKAEHLGKGDFAVVPVCTGNVEIQTLDDGFNKMAGRINDLLQHAKGDQDALRRAELELLQAQINPHFLYNTFDSIVWLAETHQNNEVVQMTTNLSTFFRNSLSKGKDIITLEAEKQQMESYLKIQQVRYRDILSYEISIPEKLLKYIIPKLTLQPLVENALYHGVKNRRGLGHISVVGHDEGDEILLTIHDDGAGMSPQQLNTLRAGVYEDKHTGLGLVNVHKRLRFYYGERYGLSFESTLG